MGRGVGGGPGPDDLDHLVRGAELHDHDGSLPHDHDLPCLDYELEHAGDNDDHRSGSNDNHHRAWGHLDESGRDYHHCDGGRVVDDHDGMSEHDVDHVLRD